MPKTDKSKHNICIAAIKRHTKKPFYFIRTNFHETKASFDAYAWLLPKLADEELVIASVVIDADNYSVLTTRRLFTREEGNLSVGDLENAKDRLYGDFKGHKTTEFTFGHVELEDGRDFKYFIETGSASMAMIYGVRTLVRIKELTEMQIEKSDKDLE